MLLLPVRGLETEGEEGMDGAGCAGVEREGGDASKKTEFGASVRFDAFSPQDPDVDS